MAKVRSSGVAETLSLIAMFLLPACPEKSAGRADVADAGPAMALPSRDEAAEENEALARRCHLEGQPTFAMVVHRVHQVTDVYTDLDFTLTNKSQARIDFVHLGATLLDGSGKELATWNAIPLDDLRAGGSADHTVHFANVEARQVKAWRFEIREIACLDDGGELVSLPPDAFTLTITADGNAAPQRTAAQAKQIDGPGEALASQGELPPDQQVLRDLAPVARCQSRALGLRVVPSVVSKAVDEFEKDKCLVKAKAWVGEMGKSVNYSVTYRKAEGFWRLVGVSSGMMGFPMGGGCDR